MNLMLPDLAQFPDYKHEPREEAPLLPEQRERMLSALEDGDFSAFIDGLPLENNQWSKRLFGHFSFYTKWQKPDYTVDELHDGLWLLNADVSSFLPLLQTDINNLNNKPDSRPPPGQMDRGCQVEYMVPYVSKLFKDLNILNVASAYNRRRMEVANVFLHISYPTDNHWKQFFYDARTTPKYTNTHIDPKEDVVKAMIYLSDVSEINGPFKYAVGSNRATLDPLQNIFGRAISTGSYCYSPEHRKSVFRLPPELRVSHNFGRCILPHQYPVWYDYLEKYLQPITSKEANIMVFDPGGGIHQGAITEKGSRLALQVLMK